MIIARIVPEATAGTPDCTKRSPLRFSITGFNIPDRYNKKGVWRVKYCLQTPQKIIKSFQIDFSWSGRWYNRLTEMNNEVEVSKKDM